MERNLGKSGIDEEISKSIVEEWSKWLDFSRDTINSVVPDESGLFKVHASMKILYIGSSSEPQINTIRFYLRSLSREGSKIQLFG